MRTRRISPRREGAKSFVPYDAAYYSIVNLMMGFEPDDEYRWTPITINIETGRVVKLYYQWHV